MISCRLGKKIKPSFKVWAAYILLTGLLVGLVWRNFPITGWLVGHTFDWNIPSHPLLIKRLVSSLFYSWSPLNLGSFKPFGFNLIPLTGIFYQPVLGNLAITHLILFTSVFGGILGCLLFLEIFRKLFLKEDKALGWFDYWLALLAAVLFTLSPFLYHDIIFGSYVQFVTYSLIPWVGFFYLRFLDDQRRRWSWLMTLLVLTLVAASTQNLIFTLVLLSALSLSSGKWRVLVKTFLLFLLLNLFWVLPLSASIFSGGFAGSPALNPNAADLFNSQRQAYHNLWVSLLGHEYFSQRNTYLSVLGEAVSLLWKGMRFLFLILIPLAAALAGRKSKGRRVVSFLLVVFAVNLLFLKGSWPPFGKLVPYLFTAFPFSNVFRSLQHFYTLYSLILAIFFFVVYRGLAARITSRRSQFLAAGLLTLVVVFNSAPWFITGDVGARKLADLGKDHIALFNLSPGYQEYYQTILPGLSDLDSFRIFTIPPSASPNYLPTEYQPASQGGDIDALLQPTLLFTGAGDVPESLLAEAEKLLAAGESEAFTRYLSFLGFKYLLVKQDVIPCFYGIQKDFYPLEAVERVANLEGVENIFQRDYISLYQLSQEVLPLIYTPTREIYLDGPAPSLAYLVMDSDWDPQTLIYTPSSGSPGEPDYPVSYLVGEDFADVDEDFDTEWHAGWSLPGAAVSPANWKYRLVRLKEAWGKRQRRNDPLEQVDLAVWYGAKRAVEINTFGLNAELLFSEYLTNMKEAVWRLQAVDVRDRGDDFWGMVTKALAYMRRSESLLAEVGVGDLSSAAAIRRELRSWADNWRAEACQSDRCFKFDILAPGTYEVFTNISHGVSLDHWRPGLVLGISTDNTIGGLTSLGQADLEPGVFVFGLKMSSAENRLLSSASRGNFWQADIRDWLADEEYEVSFEYRVDRPYDWEPPEGGDWEAPLTLAVLEERTAWDPRDDGFPITKDGYEDGRILESTFWGTNGDWRSYQTTIKRHFDARGAKVAISIAAGEPPGAVEFREVAVRRSVEPRLLLKNSSDDKEGSVAPPQVQFSRINPTRLRVEVRGAGPAYPLVFDESFSSGWRVYLVPAEGGKGLLTQFPFLEFWGRKPLPEERHFLANGFANGWRVLPEDAGGRQDYELIIEFTPQRYFYVGAGLSLAVLSAFLWYQVGGKIFCRDGVGVRRAC